jgi:type IV secretory pathway VirJ component
MHAISTLSSWTAIAALAFAPVAAAAAPLRAGASLPAKSAASVQGAARASAPAGESKLTGLPILAFVGLFGAAALIAVLASGSGGGRSPG